MILFMSGLFMGAACAILLMATLAVASREDDLQEDEEGRWTRG